MPGQKATFNTEFGEPSKRILALHVLSFGLYHYIR